MPDTFFRNEKIGSFHNILAPNLYVRIFPNGDVLYSIRCPSLFPPILTCFSFRVSLTVSCSMQLRLFPFDEQTCHLYLASCKYNVSKLKMIWTEITDGWTKTDVIYVWDDSSALQLVPNMSLPGGFKLKMFGSDYCDVTTNTGQYSCLQVMMTVSYLETKCHVSARWIWCLPGNSPTTW